MEKKLLVICLILSVFFAFTSICFAEEDGKISYDKVADSGDMAAVEKVGLEGMEPIYGKDVADGTYEVTVESSSSMFQIEKAVLTVENGKMEAVITMGGKGYLKLFMGTGKEAAAADFSEYIDYGEDEDGNHTFTIPVEALDQPISCAAFSKNKEQWYDRSLLFEAKSLPADDVLVPLPDYEALEAAERDKRIEGMKSEKEKGMTAMAVELKDGEYTIEVALGGGSGRASVTSPATLLVQDGKAYARIQWSSSNYDYMLIDGEKYLPLEGEEFSTFEIPITAFDEPIEVTADTTAMSTPHEIDYTLTFFSDSLPSSNNALLVAGVIVTIAVILAVVAILYRKRKR